MLGVIDLHVSRLGFPPRCLPDCRALTLTRARLSLLRAHTPRHVPPRPALFIRVYLYMFMNPRKRKGAEQRHGLLNLRER